MRFSAWFVAAVALCGGCSEPGLKRDPTYRLATFVADITPPIGHALCGGMVAPAKSIADPLAARGLVLLGADFPIVIAALDWTELRNDAFERWRSELARAAGTQPSFVFLSCVHQHDAPYADLGAQRLLDAQGLKGFHVDPEFHERALQAVASAVRASVRDAVPVTHLGLGEAVVESVASNRRVVTPDGKVSFKRYSKTADPRIKDAPEGTIDPKLKTISFWDGDRGVAALSVYAVHPMSYYGTGAVSADFPGLARSSRQLETPGVFQMYASGCAGDVTAAKYNGADGKSRRALAERLRAAMARAWEQTRRVPLRVRDLRRSELRFELPPAGPFSVPVMEKTIADPKAPKSDRLMAALGLSWARRVAAGAPIDVPAIDFGPAQIVLLPAEAFVDFQLAAQRARPDQMILALGYGECGPGYIPTEAARAEGYVEEHGYCWVAAGAEERLHRAVADALGAKK
jgi:hypothetical protein